MKEKIGAVNLLRFLAAIGVLLYHYMFMFYQRGLSYLDFGPLRGIAQYGYLGVDLFFIISGFVIALSAENRTWFGFLTSRMSRLYPIFWTCVSITALYILFGGYLVSEHVTWGRYFAGLTMTPGLFGQTILEGSYWTLEVELKFYFIIFIILAFRGFKKIEHLSYIAIVSIILMMSFTSIHIGWAVNFLAGILFFKIYKDGITIPRMIGVLTLLPINIHTALEYSRNLTENYNTVFKDSVVGTSIILFYTAFMLIATKTISFKDNKWLSLAGLLTYPVYLLHQQIGHILFNVYKDSVSQYASLVLVTGFILILSYLVHILVEDSGRKMIQNTMQKIAKALKLNP